MYGKLVDGRLIMAKHFIIDGKTTIINPTDEMYEKYGYKKVIEEEIPALSDNQGAEIYYEETDKEILKRYRVGDIEDDGYSEMREKAEAYDIITGVSG